MVRVGVIGAGAWGTALSIVASAAGNEVILWDRDAQLIDRIAKTHATDRPLKGLALDPSIKATHRLQDACEVDILLMVTAAQALREVAQKIKPYLNKRTYLILCSKGIEQDTGMLLTDILEQELPDTPLAVLSGPAFAGEVAQGLPTAVSIAASDMPSSRRLANSLNSKNFRLYPSDDIKGVQLGGALKNVLAIASGIAYGMELGQNAQATLLTRGLSELTALSAALGAKHETLMGLSGLGDMILTCTSLTSRNMKFGSLIGEGMTMEQVQRTHSKLAEGVATTKALRILSQRLKIELPICDCVYKILYEGLAINEALQSLLARPIRDEISKKG